MAGGSILTLQLIRHGVTAANEAGLFCGRSDPGLSPRGRAGIEQLAGEPGLYIKTGLYFTSGMTRAEETLRLIFGDVAHSTLEGFMEYDFGEFEMKSADELTGDPRFSAWLSDPEGRAPGGDSTDSFSRRVALALEALLAYMEGYGASSATLVAHGGSLARCAQIITGEMPPTAGHGGGYLAVISMPSRSCESFTVIG